MEISSYEQLAVAAGKLMLSVMVAGFLVYSAYLYELLLLRPKRTRSKLEKQGVRGPPPSFLLGNLPEINRLLKKEQSQTKQQHPHDDVANSITHHQWPSKCFSFTEQWRNEYGSIFMFALAHTQVLFITDLEMIKEICLSKSLQLATLSWTSKVVGPLFGKGLSSSNGALWLHERKIIGPELYLDKVKGMINLMVESTTSMLVTWEREIKSHEGIAEIRVDDSMRNLSADIILKACFHSNYRQGEEIFSKLKALQTVLSRGMMGVEGLVRWFPTKDNREVKRLEKEAESMILKVVKQRADVSTEEDLLQMIIEGAKSCDYHDLSQDKFIVDNYKTIFFAGYETTAISASWSLMLLAAYPEWQARVRAEVLGICGDKPIDENMLRGMKVLTMVIQESMRLYPPTPLIGREAYETITLKNIVIPKGVTLQIPIYFLHQNPEIWGPDAHQYNPERFADGIANACNFPHAYIPFGGGPRICVGQHLAMAEMKVIISLIVSKFTLTLSPKYQHSPSNNKIFTEPDHGIILQVKRL